MMLSTKSRGFFALCSFACALVCACAMLAMPVQASAAERIDDEIVIGDSDSPAISTAISAACGKLTVMVSRAYSDTDGCEYQAALDSSFKKGVRSARSSASKYQFSGLKPGKKY